MTELEKDPEAYKTIKEVGDILDIPHHVIRFWETRFTQLKPLKRGGGRRYYKPEDVALLQGIRHLLYGEGYTIRGVQRLMKTHGIKFVQGIASGEKPTNTQGLNQPQESLSTKQIPITPPKNAANQDTPIETARPDAVNIPNLKQIQESQPISGEKNHPSPVGTSHPSADNMRRLQALMFELLECKKIMESALSQIQLKQQGEAAE